MRLPDTSATRHSGTLRRRSQDTSTPNTWYETLRHECRDRGKAGTLRPRTIPMRHSSTGDSSETSAPILWCRSVLWPKCPAPHNARVDALRQSNTYRNDAECKKRFTRWERQLFTHPVHVCLHVHTAQKPYTRDPDGSPSRRQPNTSQSTDPRHQQRRRQPPASYLVGGEARGGQDHRSRRQWVGGPKTFGKKYFSAKYRVKVGHFVNFSYVYFRAKMSCPQSWLIELLRLRPRRLSGEARVTFLLALQVSIVRTKNTSFLEKCYDDVVSFDPIIQVCVFIYNRYTI